MSSLHNIEANIVSMLDPLKMITICKILGLGSYLVRYSKAKTENVQKSDHFINWQLANACGKFKKQMWANCIVRI